MQKRIVVMPPPLDERWKSWAKVLKRVETRDNGYAFVGDFVSLSSRKFEARHELNLNDLVLIYSEDGSRKYHIPVVLLYKVVAEGDPADTDGDGLVLLYEHECRGRIGWALEVRDAIARIFERERGATARREQLLQRRDQLLAELAEIERMLSEESGHDTDDTGN